MIRAISLLPLLWFVVSCGGDGPSASVGLPPEGATDSVPPVDSLPPDSTLHPPGDSVPPTPGDTTTPPPPSDTTGPEQPPYTPVHVGIPYGPTQQTTGDFSTDYSGTLIPGLPDSIMRMLEAARRKNLRLFIQFSGNEENSRDENGFNFDKWKHMVDRFKGMNFDPYIADGTILGHRIMDEPADPNNWNGHLVSKDQIDRMAQYSKELWPTMPAIIRAFPAYLKGYQYKYLDAAWAQFHTRFGSPAQFIAENVRDAQELGIGLIAGLNLINGGDGSSRIPGRKGKARQLWSMSPGEIRSYGNAIIDDPYICAFLMFEYQANYVNRPEIREALLELGKKAETHPVRECRRN